MKDLAPHAQAIAKVFRELLKAYDSGSGDSGNDIVCNIMLDVTEEQCAEIAEIAAKIKL